MKMRKPLRIGINASGLAAGKPATGLQRYTSGLLLALAPYCAAENLRLYLYFTSRVPSSARLPGTPLATLKPGGPIRWRTVPIARGWLRLGMGIAMLLDRIDVFHFPAPLVARFCPVPPVVTFHDLAALSLGADQTRKEARYLPDAADAARRAKAIIAVSESAKSEIERHFGRRDVTVITEGVDAAQFRPATADAVAAIRAKYAIERYILCVGTLQMRKNHLRLIAAFEQIMSEIPHTLVIAGGDGSGAAAVREYMAAHPNPRVRLVGYVPDGELPALYTGADVLALPSLWEGFGLPLIEAMACGVPVLTSNTSALAEVAGDAALLVEPTDAGDIADGLRAILSDALLRERLITAGLARASQYSWETAAQRTIEVYRNTAKRL